MIPGAPRRFTLALALLFFLGACRRDAPLPDPASETYRETVTAFHTGIAAVQSGAEGQGVDYLVRVTELVPQEPAAWANLGLLALRRNDLDEATTRLDQALALAPENPSILLLAAALATARGDDDAATAYLREAVAADSTSVRATYALAQHLQQRDADADQAEAQRLLATLSETMPDNLALALDAARLAAQQGTTATVQQRLDALAEQADTWPQEAREVLDEARNAAASGDATQALTQVTVLRNVLLRLPQYRQDLGALSTPPEQIGELVQHFIRLPAPPPSPAPRDDALTFEADVLPLDGGPWQWIGGLSLEGEEIPALALANADMLRIETGVDLPFPFGQDLSAQQITSLDFNYDFRIDLALVGSRGLRLYRQDEAGAFADVTAEMGLPASITRQAYTGAWPADIDSEGDIDLVLGRAAGAPVVLRNNGDGTFAVQEPFDVDGLRRFTWADLDGDGDPDAALIDGAGRVHLFANLRGGRFREAALPSSLGAATALAVGDLDNDALLDLVVLQADGQLVRVSYEPAQDAWTLTTLVRWLVPQDGSRPHLFVADLDNNGGLDVLASTTNASQLWLSDIQGDLHPLIAPIEAHVFDIEEVTGDGRLDLLGFTADGQAVRLTNFGTKPYHWKRFRPRAAQALGDQRINSFGIGGEIEVRAGLLFQKQPILEPYVHFGLGEQAAADVARIVWPNGDVQAEFGFLSDQVIEAQQRLKGSCPWLFTYDGTGMQFVTDFIWRSPLGLRINAQETAGIMTTEDWVKIRGDQLVPRDGTYDLRITAELWETHFFDHVSLLVVDHPDTTDIYVDERFAFPPPPLTVHVTAPPRPVAGARDDAGHDVTDRIRARDGQYVDGFALGAYQGIAQDHYVEIDLGDDVPTDGPLWLLAYGWLRPTDSSINVAISQGAQAPPQGLRLDVPDGAGGWVVARDGLGFPAGKNKTILIDLTDVFRPGTPRRLRLRTNLEIFWDAIEWAAALPGAETQTHRLAPAVADLRYRGYSHVYQADRSSPELPAYAPLAGTTPRWRDLVGYYTRFGDVRELLADIDDRYVIMNAGDEMIFRFPVPPAPPEGWTRDFVLIGDGWVKDGDYNTTFSKTVLPLPAHDQPEYTTPPTRLEDDPVYQRHADDWRRYHTRYVAPERFHNALRPSSP